MCVIQIRGTSGSGKSTLVRQVMGLYYEKQPLFKRGRKQPIGYILTHPDTPSLFVPGHYESACGGLDTISKVPILLRFSRGG